MGPHMRDVAQTDLDRWTEDNNRYLATSLHWLRLRLRQMAPAAQASAPAVVSAATLSASTTTTTSTTTSTSTSTRSWFGRRADHADANALVIPPQLTHDAPVLADLLSAAAVERTNAAQTDPAPALLLMAERLGLGPFETDILLLCAAMELDPSIPALIAAAQGGGSGHPSFALALQLFDEPAWDALAPQRPLRYLRLLDINQPGATPLTAAALRADERIVNAVKGLNLLDERLAALVAPSETLPDLAPSQHQKTDELLGALRAAHDSAASLPVLQLLGRDRGSRFAVAAHACAALGRRLYRLPLESLPTQRSEIETFARLWHRESLLLPVALYIEADGLDAVGNDIVAALHTLLGHPFGLVFIGLRDAPLQLGVAQWTTEVPLPSPAEHHAVWREALPPALPSEAREREAAELSGHFQLNLEQIHSAAATAQARGTDAWAVCRDLSLSRLDALAQRLEPKARWDDLVLGEEATALLRQIAGQVHERHRVYQEWGYAERMNRGLGISALFAGESGTGKTMAAEVIANELRLHLFRIDLSSVVSKYIGETEKNLRRLFDAAEQGGAILFFDEADALFGKRSEVKDSHDRYANIEINYLLQRMEAFSGLAILATNMKSALDTAFMRRLRFVVNFQFPGPVERARMWRNALAPGVPCEDLDYDRLARFGLSGGNIHSIALNAAFAAAGSGGTVSMPVLMGAVRTELRKLDKPVNEAEFR